MRPSTTKLSKMLVEFGAATAPFSARVVTKRDAPMAEGVSLSDETYGRDSRLYIGCPDQGIRRRLEAFLAVKGVTSMKTTYSPGSGFSHDGVIVEVGVTYFKGWHWDE